MRHPQRVLDGVAETPDLLVLIDPDDDREVGHVLLLVALPRRAVLKGPGTATTSIASPAGLPALSMAGAIARPGSRRSGGSRIREGSQSPRVVTLHIRVPAVHGGRAPATAILSIHPGDAGGKTVRADHAAVLQGRPATVVRAAAVATAGRLARSVPRRPSGAHSGSAPRKTGAGPQRAIKRLTAPMRVLSLNPPMPQRPNRADSRARSLPSRFMSAGFDAAGPSRGT